ncbi:hypothetical protein [Desulfogranum japonicum]|uniref:hypothetical protein n=1 Tax=Desulfogranum japonicum TaxID=231447 RepID=UPI0012947D2B|nr:hypothetical protein [Desulfogranum japonicum]
MIDICIDGARVVMERWRQFLLSPVGVYLYSLLTGSIGIVILMFFLSKVLSSGALLLLWPGIIAFNCASTGYGMINRLRSFPKANIALVSIAVLLTIVGIVSVVVLFPWESLFDWVRCVSGIVAAVGGTFFGSWIAAKKYALNLNITDGD